MDRLVLAVVFSSIAVSVGCQAPMPPVLESLGITRQTRVPAPPTGAVGQPNSNYSVPSTSAPPFQSGASTLPPSNYNPNWHSNTNYGRTYDVSPASRDIASQPADTSRETNVRPPNSNTALTRNDRLGWRENYDGNSAHALPSYSEFANTRTAFDSNYPPRRMPQPGQVSSGGLTKSGKYDLLTGLIRLNRTKERIISAL